MPTHAFVDESKAKGLLLAMTLIDSSDVGSARKTLRGLLLPGQRRLHFHNEQNTRRRSIINTVLHLPLVVRIYETGTSTNTARGIALGGLAADLEGLAVQRLVLEADDGMIAQDVRLLAHATKPLRSRSVFTFHHLPPSAEPLLWVSDAVAWCYARGGGWRTAATPIIDAVVRP